MLLFSVVMFAPVGRLSCTARGAMGPVVDFVLLGGV
jgi:hypothetical protein